MAQDTVSTETATDCEAMASVDSGSVDEYIIAYPCRDGAWVSLPLDDAAALSDWR